MIVNLTPVRGLMLIWSQSGQSSLKKMRLTSAGILHHQVESLLCLYDLKQLHCRHTNTGVKKRWHIKRDRVHGQVHEYLVDLKQKWNQDTVSTGNCFTETQVETARKQETVRDRSDLLTDIWVIQDLHYSDLSKELRQKHMNQYPKQICFNITW